MLVVVLLACRRLAATTTSPTPAPTPIPVTAVIVTPETSGREDTAQPPQTNQQMNDLLGDVSQQRLMGHVESLAAIHSRHVNSAGIGQAAQLIHHEFEAVGGRWQVRDEEFTLTFDGVLTTQRNVVATLQGSDPAAGIVLVGAHYDSRTVDLADSTSRAPGADDNATGIAALLEMARLLGEMQPGATIMFVAFAAEEVGVQGSTHYVEQALARDDDLRAMIQLDIIGNAQGGAGEGAIRVFSAPPDDSSSRQLARYVAAIGRSYLPDFDVEVQATVDRPGRYSDHVPFSDAGVPAVRFIEALEDTARQHSGFDTPDTISPAYLRRSTQLALATVFNAANGPAAPEAPVLRSPDTVAWMPVEGAAGYLVAFREDSIQEPGSLVRVGPVTSLTWDEVAGGSYTSVSVAAIGEEGLIGLFSPELALVR